MPYPSKKQLLKQHPLFQSLSWWQFGSVADRARFQEVPRGDLVVEEETPGRAFYLVASGRCEAFTNTEAGRHRVLEHYLSGDSFGELAVLSGGSYWSSVRALNDTLLLKIEKKDFDALLESNPDVGRQLSQSIAERVHLRRDRRKKRRISKLVAVGSATRQIGKSLFSLNTAAALHEETGEPVCLLDFTRQPDEPRRALPEDRDRLGEWIDDVALEHITGVHVLFTELPDQGIEDVLSALLDQLVKRFNYVFFVLGEGLSPAAREVFAQADRIFLLSNLVERNLYQTHLLINQLEARQGDDEKPLDVVMARLAPEDMHRPLSEAEDQLNHDVSYRLPELPDVSQVHKLRHLPYSLRHPDRPYSRVIRRLARQLGNVSVGLALGSGSARGLAHIGVLRVLEEENILVDVVAGTSIGALIGAGWSLGLDADEMEQRALEFKRGGGLWKWTDLAAPPTRSIFRGRRLWRVFHDWLGDATFSETRLPLRIVAANLDRLETQIIDEGSLVEAVMASIAIPILFPPVHRGGKRYVDGAVLDPIPVDALWQSGAGRIIAVNPIPPMEVLRETSHTLPTRLKGVVGKAVSWVTRQLLPFGEGNIVDTAMRSLQVMQSRMAETSEHGADVVINPVVPTETSFEFEDTERFIRQGEITARENLDEIKSLLEPPVDVQPDQAEVADAESG